MARHLGPPVLDQPFLDDNENRVDDIAGQPGQCHVQADFGFSKSLFVKYPRVWKVLDCL